MDDGSQTRAALATLFAALVKALDETSRGLESAFARHLDEAGQHLDDFGGNGAAVRQTLEWTKAMLQAESDPSEPAWIVYAPTKAWGEETPPASRRIQLESLAKAVHVWGGLPTSDRQGASIETASGRRYEAPHLAQLLDLFKTIRE